MIDKICLTCFFARLTEYGPYCDLFKCMKELEFSCTEWKIDPERTVDLKKKDD